MNITTKIDPQVKSLFKAGEVYQYRYTVIRLNANGNPEEEGPLSRISSVQIPEDGAIVELHLPVQPGLYFNVYRQLDGEALKFVGRQVMRQTTFVDLKAKPPGYVSGELLTGKRAERFIRWLNSMAPFTRLPNDGTAHHKWVKKP